MKLWHVSQWGNIKGPNEPDTQCIVRAPDIISAIALATKEFAGMVEAWKNGECNIIILLGEDVLSDAGARVVVRPWIANVIYLEEYPSWIRDDNSWEKSR